MEKREHERDQTGSGEATTVIDTIWDLGPELECVNILAKCMPKDAEKPERTTKVIDHLL